jgi:methionyl-tRNA synthetase
MEGFRFRKAVLKIWELVTASNAFVEESAPWVLNKESKTEELAGVLYALAESLRLLSVFLTPFMPETCEKLRAKLGFKALDNSVPYTELVRWGRLAEGTKIQKGEALFPRIETSIKD